MEFETVIGLEVHAELATKTKAFCSCSVTFGKEANTYCCPVCMGLPGALPVLNRQVVKYAHRLGLATECTINKESYHARKNYFYPDLPKGYQISQSDLPLCENGFVEINGRKIGINRIHIEEDAGKLLHEGDETKIDFNRAGVPLVEIVTEPDLNSSAEAKLFLEKIREILMYLEISRCRMEEGQLRCDVNVSLRRKGECGYGERCEMKNINSFSGVVRCIEYEEKRQRDIIINGGRIKRETRRWDDDAGESYLMRNKENQEDYRYFTEPDLPGIFITDKDEKEAKESLPLLPEQLRQKYKEKYNFTDCECNEIVKNKCFTRLLDEAVLCGGNPKKVYNWLVSDVARIVNEKCIEDAKIPFGGKELAELTEIIEKGEISSTVGKAVLEAMFVEGKSPSEIVKEKHFTQLEDAQTLTEVVREAVKNSPKSVADYKKGKKNAIGYLMGQCMRMTDNKANPKVLNNILIEILEEEQ